LLGAADTQVHDVPMRGRAIGLFKDTPKIDLAHVCPVSQLRVGEGGISKILSEVFDGGGEQMRFLFRSLFCEAGEHIVEIIPNGDTVIEEDDRLLMLSLISDIASTEKLLKDSSKLGFFRGL